MMAATFEISIDIPIPSRHHKQQKVDVPIQAVKPPKEVYVKPLLSRKSLSKRALKYRISIARYKRNERYF